MPSDLELMPHLKQFLEQNGTLLSNVHTPLIAHTADDSLTSTPACTATATACRSATATRPTTADGTTESDGSFVYWTSPVYNSTARAVSSTEPTTPSMVYSPTVPATPGATGQHHPGPVGAVHPGRLLGRRLLHREHGAGEHERRHPQRLRRRLAGGGGQQRRHRRSRTRPPRSTWARPCTAPRPTPPAPLPSGRAPTRCPTEPGGYTASRRCSGTSTSTRSCSGGQANLVHNGYQVTDANGDQVDLDGNTITNSFAGTPGFPGFSPAASQTLANLATMQEAGIPVTYGYISDIHERKAGQTGCTTAGATATGYPLGPGDPCYLATAAGVRPGVREVLRPAGQGRHHPEEHLFVITAEENDHLAGANTLRATTPTPAGCDGVTVACNYAASQVGELQANLPLLVQKERGNTTPFAVEPQGAAMYVNGQPGPTNAALRQLERDTAALTGEQPVQRHERRDDRQLPGRRGRAAHPAPADRRHRPHAELHHLPQARLLLRRDLPRCAAVDEPGGRLRGHLHPVRLGPRLLLAGHRHHLGRLRRTGRGPARAGRARPEPRPDGHRGRPERPADADRPARRAAARGPRRPTSGRPCCRWSGCATTTCPTAPCSAGSWRTTTTVGPPRRSTSWPPRTGS